MREWHCNGYGSMVVCMYRRHMSLQYKVHLCWCLFITWANKKSLANKFSDLSVLPFMNFASHQTTFCSPLSFILSLFRELLDNLSCRSFCIFFFFLFLAWISLCYFYVVLIFSLSSSSTVKNEGKKKEIHVSLHIQLVFYSSCFYEIVSWIRFQL